MPSIHETAYPRLKSNPSPRELADIYTPTKDEMALADRVARSSIARLRHQDCTDNLVRTLREVVVAYQLEGDALQWLEKEIAAKLEPLSILDTPDGHRGNYTLDMDRNPPPPDYGFMLRPDRAQAA